MNIDKPCNSSSCESAATGRRSKKLTEYHRFITESLTRIFLTFVFLMHRDSKRICKRYRLRLLRLRPSNILSLIKQVPYTCRIRVIRSIRVQKKHSRMNYIKLNTNLPNLSNIYHVEPKKIRVIRAITSLWSVGLRQISCSKKNIFAYELY